MAKSRRDVFGDVGFDRAGEGGGGWMVGYGDRGGVGECGDERGKGGTYVLFVFLYIVYIDFHSVSSLDQIFMLSDHFWQFWGIFNDSNSKNIIL